MNDVNPLGPMMHLKQIEREALGLRAATAEGSSGTLSIRAWIIGALKRLFTSPRAEARVRDRLSLGRQ